MPDEDPIAGNEDGQEDGSKEPRMYFVAKGKFDVYVTKNHGVSVNKYTTGRRKEKPDRIL